MNSLPAIILAAGMSQRMGTCKQLLPFNGKPLLAHLLEVLQSIPEISPVFVVTGHFKEEISPLLNVYKATAVHNPNYAEEGMLSSIQIGVANLPADCKGFLLLLGDQPFLTTEVLNALITASKTSKAPTIQPEYAGKRGHPILFRASCIPEILALPADATLKTLMARHSENRHTIPVSHSEILADIDTPEEYADALKQFAEPSQNRTSRY